MMSKIGMSRQPPTAPAHISLLALGFRPFFLAAGLVAVLAIGVWLGVLRGIFALPPDQSARRSERASMGKNAMSSAANTGSGAPSQRAMRAASQSRASPAS
ncbi:MAG: NnrS family protein, partial [Chromatiaceae bacterium]